MRLVCSKLELRGLVELLNPEHRHRLRRRRRRRRRHHRATLRTVLLVRLVRNHLNAPIIIANHLHKSLFYL